MAFPLSRSFVLCLCKIMDYHWLCQHDLAIVTLPFHLVLATLLLQQSTCPLLHCYKTFLFLTYGIVVLPFHLLLWHCYATILFVYYYIITKHFHLVLITFLYYIFIFYLLNNHKTLSFIIWLNKTKPFHFLLAT